MKVNWLALSAIIPTATGLVVGAVVFMFDLKSDLKAHVEVTQTEIVSIKTNYGMLHKNTETNRAEVREDLRALRGELNELRGNLTHHQEIHVKESNNGNAKN